MADYRDLLRRAIDALPENTGANRRAVYEKARGALVSQLRAIVPPLHAREITTQRLYLEDGIRQVEQEATDKLLGRLREVEDVPLTPAPSTSIDVEQAIRVAEQALDDAVTFAQRPAAFQFQQVDGKIVASAIGKVPPTPVATDLHAELLRKAKSLFARLKRTQAPPHVSEAIEGLIEELGSVFHDVRPGILLSRSRAIEASLTAYSDADQREALMPDALALLTEVVALLDDFKALYPELLSLEAARLAQNLGLDDTSTAYSYASEIVELAASSGLVDDSAIDALQAPTIDISSADKILADTMDADRRRDAYEVRAKIIAQQLLDVRNFVAAAIAAAKSPTVTYLEDASVNAREGTLDGIKYGSKGLIQGGFVALSSAIFGPVGGLAALVVTFRPLMEKARQVKQENEAGNG